MLHRFRLMGKSERNFFERSDVPCGSGPLRLDDDEQDGCRSVLISILSISIEQVDCLVKTCTQISQGCRKELNPGLPNAERARTELGINFDELWGRALTDSVLCQTGLVTEFTPGVWSNPCGGRAFRHLRTDDQSTPTASEKAFSSWPCGPRSCSTCPVSIYPSRSRMRRNLASTIGQSRIEKSIGLKRPLFEPSAEQAVRPHTMSISARRSMWSPGFEVGTPTVTFPCGSTLTFIKMLKVVEI